MWQLLLVTDEQSLTIGNGFKSIRRLKRLVAADENSRPGPGAFEKPNDVGRKGCPLAASGGAGGEADAA